MTIAPIAEDQEVERRPVEGHQLRRQLGYATDERRYELLLGALAAMGCAECVDYPMAVVSTSDRGGAAALQDLVGGQIDLSCDLAANSLSQLRDGNIKAYAVMSKTRWFAAPEVPTADEAGVPGLYISTWHGFWAPKGTPEAIVAKLNGAALAAMADPTVGQRIADLGMDLPPRELQAPAAFAAFHKTEVEKWFPIVKAAGIKAE